MALTRDQLKQKFRNREFAPVYVFYGEETYLRDNAVKAIVQAAFAEGEFRDFNDDQFSLNSPETIATALVAANQLPMMASRRVVRITEVRVSTSSSKDTLKEDAEDALAAYLANPSPTSIVIFIADELNGNRKLGKLLKAQPAAVEFKKLDQSELHTWAGDIFRKAEVKIDANAVRKLVDLIGSDVRRLETEAAKLCTASLPNNEIDTALVDSLVRSTRELGNFDFAEHLVSDRKKEAVFELRKLLADGEEPLALLGSLGWKYRDAMKRTSARSAYSDKLAHAIRRIAETDLAIKTSVGGGGPIGGRMQIEMLVCELAN
ncbi:MAG: DNA polymerase III subunit delta [Pyrinomonadaceae bacterium]